MQKTSIAIIGGGLAGLTAAIHLSKLGYDVTVFEKNTFPRHKVCGEYISNEVLPYLQSLDIDVASLAPTNITDLHFSTTNGTSIKIKLPLGGFGISRFVLDEYLYKKALKNGAIVLIDNVTNVQFDNNHFTINTTENGNFTAKIVIGAFGKRSTLDTAFNRKFILKKSNWLAVKAHYSGDFDNSLVGLHNFFGGYCGVSKVENNRINICYITNYDAFKSHKNIVDFENKIVTQNPFLKNIFDNSTISFEKPLTISQISFAQKPAIENHIIMIGDTAGLIHPLCGNGMAMAIKSAKIAAEIIDDYLTHKITSRTQVEQHYQNQWNKNFRNRLFFGRTISKILQKPKLATLLIRIFIKIPSAVSLIIKNTHGKPF